MRADTANWIATAEYDLETAQVAFDTGHSLHVMLWCYRAVERLLKANVTEVTHSAAPGTRDWRRLARASGVEIPPAYGGFLDRLQKAGRTAEYPPDVQQAIREYPEPVARTFLDETRAFMQWLNQQTALSAAAAGA